MLRTWMCIGMISLIAIFALTEICSAAAMTEGYLMKKNPVNNPVRDTGQVVFQFTAASGGETDGMAWDGTNLWVGVDGLDRIYKFDTLGNLLDSIPAPNTTATGLTWDGQYLWCADGGTIYIYKLDPATGAILDSIPGPGAGASCEGLAWMHDTLWNTNWGDNIIWALDPATGNIWHQFPAPSTGSTGLTWDWHDNALWHTSQTAPSAIFKLDPVTGIVITSFASPDAVPQDLAFDGNYLWTCGWYTGEVYKMDIGYVGIEEHEPFQTMFTTLQISPNPFHDRVNIKWQIVDNRSVGLKIYDATGRLVKGLNHMNNNQILWNGTDDANRKLPSGVYFLKFEAGDYSGTEKLLLIR